MQTLMFKTALYDKCSLDPFFCACVSSLIEREKTTGYSVSDIRSMRVQTPARCDRLSQSAGKENNAYYI